MWALILPLQVSGFSNEGLAVSQSLGFAILYPYNNWRSTFQKVLEEVFARMVLTFLDDRVAFR